MDIKATPLKAHVTHVVDPLNFSARIGTEEELKSISDFVHNVNEYGKSVSRVNRAAVLPGQSVIARSRLNGGQWQSAVVLSGDQSDSEDGEVDVMYLDYGNTEFVFKKNLIVDLPENVEALHCNVHNCQLYGIEPYHDTWTPRAIDRFVKLVANQTLNVSCISGGDASLIELVLFIGGDGVTGTSTSVAEILVSEGLAKLSRKEKSIIQSSCSNSPLTLGIIPQFDIDRFQDMVSTPSPVDADKPDFEVEIYKSGLDLEYQCEAYTDVDILNRRFQKRNLYGEIGDLVKEATDAHYRPSNPIAEMTEVCKAPHDEKKSFKRKDKHVNESKKIAVTTSAQTNGLKNLPKKIRDENTKKQSRDPREPANQKSTTSHSKHSTFDEHVVGYVHGDSIARLVRDLELCLFDGVHIEDTKSIALSKCLECIVKRALRDADFFIPAVEVINKLKDHCTFPDVIVNVMKNYASKCVKLGRNEKDERLCETYCEFSALLYLRASSWPKGSPSVCDFFDTMVDKWAIFDRKGNSQANSGLLDLYSKCLKSFLCVIAKNSVKLIDEKFASVVDEVTEKLLSKTMSRFVKVAMLNILTCIEIERYRQKLEKNNTDTLKLSSGSDNDVTCQVSGDLTSSQNWDELCHWPLDVATIRPDCQVLTHELPADRNYSRHITASHDVVDSYMPSAYLFQESEDQYPIDGDSPLYAFGFTQPQCQFPELRAFNSSTMLNPPPSHLSLEKSSVDLCKPASTPPIGADRASKKKVPESRVADVEFPILEKMADLRLMKTSTKKSKGKKLARQFLDSTSEERTPLPFEENVNLIPDGNVRHAKKHAKKHAGSLGMVHQDFLKKDQHLTGDVEDGNSPDEKETDFVPMFVCTNCGDRTHTIRDCQRGLSAMFCDSGL